MSDSDAGSVVDSVSSGPSRNNLRQKMLGVGMMMGGRNKKNNLDFRIRAPHKTSKRKSGIEHPCEVTLRDALQQVNGDQGELVKRADSAMCGELLRFAFEIVGYRTFSAVFCFLEN